MANIVKRLAIKAKQYRSEVYPNPGKFYQSLRSLLIAALAYHYAQIQALAFEEDFDPSSAEFDKTIPRYEGMHRAAGDFMKEWNLCIAEDERAVTSLKGGSKRSAAPATQIAEGDLADVAGAFAQGELSKVNPYGRDKGRC